MNTVLLLIIIASIILFIATAIGYKYFLHQYVGQYVDKYVAMIPFIGTWLTTEGFGLLQSPTIANLSINSKIAQDKTIGSTRVMGHGNQCMWDKNKCNIWGNTALGEMSNNGEFYRQQKEMTDQEDEQSKIYLESWIPTKKIVLDKLYPPGTPINNSLMNYNRDIRKKIEESFKSDIGYKGVSRGGDNVMIDIGRPKIV
jgi:hypothetical protein